MQQRGGRPKKDRKNRGRRRESSNLAIADTILRHAPPSWLVSAPLTPSRFLPPATVLSLSDLQCPICDCIVDQPVETPCQKLVCAVCIAQHIRSSEGPAILCPCCDNTHDLSFSFSPAPEVVLKVLGSLLIQCDKSSCTEVVALQNLRAHVNSGCRQTAQYSPSHLTVAQLYSRSLVSPPTTMEQKAATSVVKRMISASSSSGSSSQSASSQCHLVKLPTAGQVSLKGKWVGEEWGEL